MCSETAKSIAFFNAETSIYIIFLYILHCIVFVNLLTSLSFQFIFSLNYNFIFLLNTKVAKDKCTNEIQNEDAQIVENAMY